MNQLFAVLFSSTPSHLSIPSSPPASCSSAEAAEAARNSRNFWHSSERTAGREWGDLGSCSCDSPSVLVGFSLEKQRFLCFLGHFKWRKPLVSRKPRLFGHVWWGNYIQKRLKSNSTTERAWSEKRLLWMLPQKKTRRRTKVSLYFSIDHWFFKATLLAT